MAIYAAVSILIGRAIWSSKVRKKKRSHISNSSLKPLVRQAMLRHLLFGLSLSLLPGAAFFAVASVVSTMKIDALGLLPFIAFLAVLVWSARLLWRVELFAEVSNAVRWLAVLVFALFWVPLLWWGIAKFVCIHVLNECF
jgi:hypothetical protein